MIDGGDDEMMMKTENEMRRPRSPTIVFKLWMNRENQKKKKRGIDDHATGEVKSLGEAAVSLFTKKHSHRRRRRRRRAHFGGKKK